MKNKMITTLACLTLTLMTTASFANDSKKVHHDNKTPINNQAAEGVKDNNAAVAAGDLTPEQGAKLNHKDMKIERAEQKNADRRHGLVAKSDHAKFNKRAKKVNHERSETVQKNAEEKAEAAKNDEHK